LLQGCTWMVWLLHPISFPDLKTVCALYWVSGNKTSSNPNPNRQSASIYSQPHVLRFPCHILVKHRWSDDVDRFGNHWQISTVVGKAFHPRPKNERCMRPCQMSQCKLAEYSELETHAKSSIMCDYPVTLNKHSRYCFKCVTPWNFTEMVVVTRRTSLNHRTVKLGDSCMHRNGYLLVE